MNKTIGLIIAVLIAFGVTEVQAGVSVLVDVDEASFDGPRRGAGPFNVEGDTGAGAGSFQCWGWVLADGSTNVSQLYNIVGRGAIMTQGREGDFLAVVGGTGDFVNARGEGVQVFTDNGFNFDIEFDLTGAGGGS